MLMDTVMRAIQTNLTHDQRHVIILRFMEGCSLQETATIMGKQVNNVKVIQNRAIAALRQVLGFRTPGKIGATLQTINHASPIP